MKRPKARINGIDINTLFNLLVYLKWKKDLENVYVINIEINVGGMIPQEVYSSINKFWGSQPFIEPCPIISSVLLK